MTATKPTPHHGWRLATAAGAGLALALLQPESPWRDQLPLLLSAGLAWGTLQWLALRGAPLRPTPLWPAATAVGWLLAAPVMQAAAALLPGSLAPLQQSADGTLFPLPGWLAPLAGLTLLLSVITFYALVAGLPLVLPQFGLLYARADQRRSGGFWLGRAYWGWVMGLFGGTLIYILILGPLAFLPAVALPYPLAAALIGGAAGYFQAWFVEDLVRGEDPEAEMDDAPHAGSSAH